MKFGFYVYEVEVEFFCLNNRSIISIFLPLDIFPYCLFYTGECVRQKERDQLVTSPIPPTQPGAKVSPGLRCVGGVLTLLELNCSPRASPSYSVGTENVTEEGRGDRRERKNSVCRSGNCQSSENQSKLTLVGRNYNFKVL